MNGMVVEQPMEDVTEHTQDEAGLDGGRGLEADPELEVVALTVGGDGREEAELTLEQTVADEELPTEHHDELASTTMHEARAEGADHETTEERTESVVGRRNRKRGAAIEDPSPTAHEPHDDDADGATADGAAQTQHHTGDHGVAVEPAGAVADDEDWQRTWPDNELRIVAALDPFSTRAPGVDGIIRIRAMVDITEIDPESGQAGTVANVPIQILPMAQGWGPIYLDIVAARRAKRRLDPIPVLLHGTSKRMRDQDRRYANARWATLFGFEISRVTRLRTGEAHYGVWRGRGTVARRGPYTINDELYERVTLHVRSERRKPQLRGASVQLDEVDVLVHTDHPHADRFGRVGASLLVEAEVTSQTNVLRSTHPDLEGLDDERRGRLQVVRQGLLIVTLGEWADVAQVAAHDHWVEAGRPIPARPRRAASGPAAPPQL